jgi:hemerythrin
MNSNQQQQQFNKLVDHFKKKTNLDLRQNTRKREIVELKAAFSFVIRTRFRRRVTLTEIGYFLSRNHTNIVYLIKTYENVISKYNPELSEIVQEVLNNEKFFDDDKIRQAYRGVRDASQIDNELV